MKKPIQERRKHFITHASLTYCLQRAAASPGARPQAPRTASLHAALRALGAGSLASRLPVLVPRGKGAVALAARVIGGGSPAAVESSPPVARLPRRRRRKAGRRLPGMLRVHAARDLQQEHAPVSTAQAGLEFAPVMSTVAGDRTVYSACRCAQRDVGLNAMFRGREKKQWRAMAAQR